MKTKLRLSDEQKRELAPRLQEWSYWRLLLGFVLTSSFFGLDVVIVDFVPFIDELFLAGVSSTFGWALLKKLVNRTPTKW